MKKLAILGLVLAVGTGVAFASSIGVPWFVDNQAENAGNPATSSGTTGIITLKNMTDTQKTLEIAYYNAAGEFLGPLAPNNTFTVDAFSSLAFRPVATDPGKGVVDPRDSLAETLGGGTEGGQGVLVPNRPRSPDASTPVYVGGPIDSKKNGSAVISWTGGPGDINGMTSSFNMLIEGSAKTTMSFGHLLPAGV